MKFVKAVFILAIAVSIGPVVEADGINSLNTTAPETIVNQPSHQNDTAHIAEATTDAESTATFIGFDANDPDTAGLKAGGLCSCNGELRTGDRVVALVDSPSSASGILTGDAGTVGCGSSTYSDQIYIVWDDWVNGHSGNSSCDCPDGWNFNANAGWWVYCVDIAPIATASAQCVCGGDYWVGARVRATVNSPQGASGIYIGREGELVCGSDTISPPYAIYVKWDGWTHGLHQSELCTCPTTALADTTYQGWWIGCSDVELASEAGCVCGGYFAAGGRVSAAVDNPGGAAGILQGHMGTVVCGTNTGGDPLIRWDNWQSGHNGNGHCDCPVTSLPDTSGWYVGCDMIYKEHGHVFSDGLHTGDTSNWD